MIERGKAEGINFSYGGNVANTIDSHRLIEKARAVKGEQGQLDFVEKSVVKHVHLVICGNIGLTRSLFVARTFKTYFEEEGDPGSHELLARDAESVGLMTKDEVSRARSLDDPVDAECEC